MTFRAETPPTTPPAAPEASNLFGTQTSFRKTIDGRVWVTHLWPAGVAFDTLPKLVALSSGPASLVVGVIRSMMTGDGVEGAEISGTEVREGLLALSREIVTQGGSDMLKTMLESTLLQPLGDKAGANAGHDFDVVFQGRLGLAIDLTLWVLEVNLRPLASAGKRQGLQAKAISWLAKLAPESPPTPTSSTSPTADKPSGSASPASGKPRSGRSKRRGRSRKS